MFVEKLKLEQVKEFLKENLLEDLYYPIWGFQVELKKFGAEEWSWWVDYISLADNGYRTFRLLNDGITPLFDRSFEEAWIKHLHSVFGEEYKEWFMAQKAKLFD